MAQMTTNDIRRILVACAGEGDGLPLDGDFAEWPFTDMGYDSLALLETAAQIKQEFGVVVPDQAITEVRTPRELVDLVNGLAAHAA